MPKALFFQNFRKLQKFSNTLHIFTIFIRQVLMKIFDLEFDQKLPKWGFQGPREPLVQHLRPMFFNVVVAQFFLTFFQKCDLCVLGAKSPFFQNFRKLQKFLNTLHTFSIFIRQVLPEILMAENTLKNTFLTRVISKIFDCLGLNFWICGFLWLVRNF